MIRIIEGDCRLILPTLEAASVQCVVTSPPYFGLRDYGTGTWSGGDPECDHVVGAIRTGLGLEKLGERYAGGGHKAAEPKALTAKAICPRCSATRIDSQIGLEASPADFITEMVAVFREVRRVLRNDGCVFLNLGDSYANDTKWGGSSGGKHVTALHGDTGVGRGKQATGLKSKDLMMIPARVAIALQADGWYLRSDIIWAKPNPMPESVTDRPTSSHEHVFLLTKQARYFYDADAVAERSEYPGDNRAIRTDVRKSVDPMCADNGSKARTGQPTGATRNLRNVWTIATAPYSEAHFATFPPELAERCIKAGSRPGDTILDPFSGAGTTALVADRLNRHAIGIELNPTYASMARSRVQGDAPLFAEVS